MLHSLAHGLAAAALPLLFLIATYSNTSLSARPVASSSLFSAEGSGPRLDTSPQTQRQSSLAGPSGFIDISTLKRGDIYAINVYGSSFQLSRVDMAPLLLAHANGMTAASLTASLRSAHPGENVGWAWFADTYSADGWYRLELRIDDDAPFPDVVKARAAGFMEGNLQGPQMLRYWTNYRINEYSGRGENPSQELYDWFDVQYGWMTSQVEAATGWDLATLRGLRTPAPTPTADPSSSSSSQHRYWSHVGLVAAQFEGLAAGFWASVKDPALNMTWHELYALNAVGDLYELNVLFPPSPPLPPTPPSWPSSMSEAAVVATAAVRQRHYTPGHGEVGEYGYGEVLECSAIVKLDPGSASDEGGGDSFRESGGAAAAAFASAGLGSERAAAGPRGGARGRRRNFWASHNTWRSYYGMVRTWKVYDLPWCRTGPVTVSSSPGLLHSKDDWYTTDTFVVMETTNGIYNKSLYDMIQPECVLMWQRAQVANFAARDGPEWVDLFGRHNSGTYNNQWMVLDVDQLQQPGARSDVLWVLEQVPGRTVSADVTQVLLDQGYWASYNVPYFPEIYNLTAYPQPSIYATCPRARIFGREQSRLTSLSDVLALMRLNRYKTDPLSLGLPSNAIAARYDLPGAPDAAGQPRNWTRRAYGAVDAKVVDLDSFRKRRTYVINGPTANDQPVFRWSADPIFDAVRHEGCVDEFNFSWQTYEAIAGPPTTRRDAARGRRNGAEAAAEARSQAAAAA